MYKICVIMENPEGRECGMQATGVIYGFGND